MRLLNVHTLEFRDFPSDSVPPYVVTSHRWSPDEATYKDVLKRKHPTTTGYQKIINFCNFARQVCGDPRRPDRLVDWIWIDTCCINQNSSAEVSESINSMWGWYSNATHCIAHLRDVRSFTSEGGWEGVLFDFRRSEWFERGWTLQELLAPQCVVFVTHNWEVIGRKSPSSHFCNIAPHPMNRTITEITGIPNDVLCGFESRRHAVSKEMKMAWAANRRTTKAEDVAYCLLGIFDVHMPLIYGEGERNARKRLEQEIRNRESEEDDLADSHKANLHRPDRETLSRDPPSPVMDAEMKNANAAEYARETGECPVCKQFMSEPVRTHCGHTFCETCLPGRTEDDLTLLFDPLDAEGMAGGDAALQNFGRRHECPVCGNLAYVRHNSSLAHYLQTNFFDAHMQRSAAIYQALEDCEILSISIGNYHELVGPGAHRWTFFVRPSRTDIVDLVFIQLHESFNEHRDNLFRKPPYTVHGQGWGYFLINISVVLKAGYVWVSKRAESGPYGAPMTRLNFQWTVDFGSHGGRGSMGRCRAKFRRERSLPQNQRVGSG